MLRMCRGANPACWITPRGRRDARAARARSAGCRALLYDAPAAMALTDAAHRAKRAVRVDQPALRGSPAQADE
jgi:hypothetical protein